jgi:hypothetical protein
MDKETSQNDPQKQTSILQRKDKIVPPPFTSPFEHIALAFSGGGFRAASFALGVLSYLNEVTFFDHISQEECTLLKKVRYLSSASGGTIATIMYALHSVSGDKDNFEVFYNSLYVQLRGNGLLQQVLEVLTGTKEWKNRPEKSKNMINSFSIIYDKALFQGATVKQLLQHREENYGHLEEVYFNATEFFRGLLFRQQIKMKPDAKDDAFYFGNSIVQVIGTTWEKIKLGDIMAATSCFPAGFEPIIYPRDFSHKDLGINELKLALHIEKQTDDENERLFIEEKTIGLMDGGITDNQGLESLMMAQEKRIKNRSEFKPFDFMMVNDVGSHYMNPYEVPSVKKGWISILTLNGIFIILLLLIVASGWFGFKAINHKNAGFIILTSTIFIASSVFFILLLYAGNLIKGTTKPNSSFNLNKNFGRKVLGLILSFLKKTGVNFLVQMVKARARSVMILNSDVFLKRIRFLLYDSFYSSPLWKSRGKGNHVYDLAFTNDINRHSRKESIKVEPSRDMQIVAETAYQMGTTLWFDKSCVEEKHSLECLIATGQFTTCYNLLEYIERLRQNNLIDSFSPSFQDRIKEIERKLIDDFEKFRTDPFYLVNKLGSNMPEFNAIDISLIQMPDNFKGIK